MRSKLSKNYNRLIAVRKAKCQLIQTSYIKRINCSCFCHIINILLTELSRSVRENLEIGRVYRPNCVRSVLKTSTKIKGDFCVSTEGEGLIGKYVVNIT